MYCASIQVHKYASAHDTSIQVRTYPGMQVYKHAIAYSLYNFPRPQHVVWVHIARSKKIRQETLNSDHCQKEIDWSNNLELGKTKAKT